LRHSSRESRPESRARSVSSICDGFATLIAGSGGCTMLPH
jgi:hypothetical protein